MRAKRIALGVSAVALATMSGCAARVYDNRYAYDDRYAYNSGYADSGYAYNDGYDTYGEAGLAVSAPGELVVLPGTDIYAAPSIGAELYFVDGYWWRPYQGHWYRSHYYDRGWAQVSAVPYFYGYIPHGWRDDYYHGRWRGRPHHYYHVDRNEVSSHWDRWKREGYWRNDRYARDRDRYRRDRVATDPRRYDNDRPDRYQVSEQDRRDALRERDRNDRPDRYTTSDRDRYDERRSDRPDRYTTSDRDRRDTTTYGAGERTRPDRYDRTTVERRVEPTRETSPGYRYERSTTTRERYGSDQQQQRYGSGSVRPVERERREVRPTTRTRVEPTTRQRVEPTTRTRVEQQRTAPVTRTRPAPTVRRTETPQPARRGTTVRTETEQRRATPTRSSDRGRSAPTQSNRDKEKQDRPPF